MNSLNCLHENMFNRVMYGSIYLNFSCKQNGLKINLMVFFYFHLYKGTYSRSIGQMDTN